MIYLELFLSFLKVGCFAFGGAYGAIPLIREVVLSHGWMDQQALTTMIAISESTPGPIMVNMATYVGSTQAGIPGALIATAAVVLPSFLIIVIISALLKTFIQKPVIQAIMKGLKWSIIGIILATGICIILRNCWTPGTLDIKTLLLTVLMAAIYWGVPRFTKWKISPIGLILLAALLGIIFYGI